MSIASKFEKLITNLRVTNTDTISSRYKAITKRLNADFWNSASDTTHSRYVGSYGRGTATKGISDIDMIMQLPYDVYAKYNGYQSNGQSALLQAVRESILKTYSTTEVGGDGQVVVVSFTDMTFELVPVFLNKDNSYTYPDSNNGGSWKTCNPVAEIDAINEANNKYNGKVKDLGKMTRAWKEKCSVNIPGILIDTLAYNFMKTWSSNDKSYMYYDWMTRDFLEYLSNQSSQHHWLAPGSNRYVYPNGNFQYKAKQSYNDALKAIEYEGKSQEASANQKWRDIFGTYFPNS